MRDPIIFLRYIPYLRDFAVSEFQRAEFEAEILNIRASGLWRLWTITCDKACYKEFTSSLGAITF